jgi:hypothetical protein
MFCRFSSSLNQTHESQKKIPLSIVGLCENVDFMETAPQADSLLKDVEKFLKQENLSATRFGVLAAGDTKFVGTLRKGRKVRSSTEQRVREWMSAQTESAGA